MAKLLAPEDLPIWVPGRVLLQSDGLGWNGVSLRSYRYKGQDVEIPAMRDFMLVAYRVGVTPMERRFDGRWSQATCGPGAVSLLTRSQRSRWHWTEDVDVTHIYLTQGFVADVAQEATGRPVDHVALADVLRADDPQVVAAVNAISSEAAQVGLGGPLYVEAVARQLVVHLLRRYADVRFAPAARPGQLSPAQRRAVEEFVDAHLHGSLDLRTLAAVANLGPDAFARRFKQTVGAPPYAYVTERRLERARQLLADTVAPIKRIAAACGFADQAHLTRHFARRHGVAPAAFRKEAQARRPGPPPMDEG